MDPETLVTFLFRAPLNVRVVELLGSWDNFTRPYSMHHDRRRGTGCWSGCFKFHDIIFDGMEPHWSKPRSGGLKQGGMYWYYYRLDYDLEAYDDLQQCTAGCPLMPGQTMNVMEVPTEITPPPSRCRSACFENEALTGTLNALASFSKRPARQTLEPSDKFARLEPPPVSKVHGRCMSDLALDGRLEGHAAPERRSIVSPLLSPCEDQIPANTANDTRPESRTVASPLLSPCDEVEPHLEAPLDYRPSSLSESRPSTSYGREVHSAARSSAHSSVIDCYAVPSGDEPTPLYDPLTTARPASAKVEDVLATQLENFDFGMSDRTIEDIPEETASYYAPASIRDVQIYGSPPASASFDEAEDRWRPRMYSLGNSTELHEHTVNTPSCAACSHPPADDLTAGTKPNYLCSPTFSAATLSSNSGFNTPFRLSVGYSRDTTAYTHDPQAIDDVANRLHSLRASGSASSSPRYQAQEQLAPPTFAGYALPQPAMESVHSLGKLSTISSHRGGANELPHMSALPALVMERNVGGGSMVEDIFSELGYLGGSIN